MPSQRQEQTSLWPWRGKQPEYDEKQPLFKMPEELFCPPLNPPTKNQATIRDLLPLVLPKNPKLWLETHETHFSYPNNADLPASQI